MLRGVRWCEMKRRVFNILVGVWVAFILAVTALWGRSYSYSDEISRFRHYYVENGEGTFVSRLESICGSVILSDFSALHFSLLDERPIIRQDPALWSSSSHQVNPDWIRSTPWHGFARSSFSITVPFY